jgi:anti-sigma factor RsiW
MCREVQAQLPRFVDGSLSAWRRWLVRAHLRGCDRCTAELERQRDVVEGLRELETVVDAAAPAPPEGLLVMLLEHAERPGVRGRVAVPARGAVSGARPALSVALLVAGAAAGTAAAYAGWRGARAFRELLSGRRPS